MPAEGESVNDSRRRQLLLQNYTPPPQKFNQYSFVCHAHMVNELADIATVSVTKRKIGLSLFSSELPQES